MTVADFTERVERARREKTAKERRRGVPPEWIERCIKSQTGQPIPNVFNAHMGLKSDPAIAMCFAYDEMLCATMLVAVLPGQTDFTGPRPATDDDVSICQEYLQQCGLARISNDVVHRAVDLRARERGFHPVQDYLNAVQWGGHPRTRRWLTYYLGADDSEYHAEIGQMFLVGAVARIFEAGCKLDHMLIFEGRQGSLKSTVCSIMGGEWFSDSLPDVTSGKDVSAHLAGKWFIEVAEMSALSRAEAASLKAFLTRSVERYRPPYGRKEVIQPRQCVFVGTTNKTAYLKDETGGRRFWPVRVGVIDAQGLADDRDQLFAEAMRLYRGGHRWWPDADFERQHITPQQEERFDADAWEDKIARHLASSEGTKVTVTGVANDALELRTDRIGTAERNRITAIFERLGWERAPREGGSRPWRKAMTQ